MSDETIKKQVVEQMFWDTRVDASDVGVMVKNGEVTLVGVVPSYYAKSSSLDDSYLVRGVSYVDNQLTVKYPNTPTDSNIKEYIENVLLWDLDLDNSKIMISVEDGVVKLTGTAGTYWEKYLAQEDAYRVGGVIDVQNEIGIVLTESHTDERVAKDIEAAIDRTYNIDVNDVSVEVQDGTVTLTGQVPSWSVRSSAYNCARYTSGVFEVDNQLTIGW